MSVLPEPTPTALAAGQAAVDDQARQLAAAVEAIYHGPTAYRDDSTVPAIGTAPPVPQPGRPPMSQRAVDLNTTILSVGAASLPIGGMIALVLHELGTVDPAQLALGAAAPAALAVPILAVARLIRRAGEAAPPVINNHYNAPVDQRTVHSKTGGLWVKNTNQQ